jgi:hypothetical protein
MSSMDDGDRLAAVSGTCVRCGDALGYAAVERDERWYCCGPCVDSDRCTCGCKPELARSLPTDWYVPTRRMFASRAPDELRGAQEARARRRAFPFADAKRGR